jgi:hypothetical protein
MGRLVYHDLTGIPGKSSPFDEAVLEVARSSSVGIVSPYIGVDYLLRIIKVSDGWRLISDIEAWLSSLSMRARPKAWLFIRENLDNIHHYPAIHAKAVIGHKLAMFGSANLTNTGILGRTELGMLIDDPAMVAELCGWFDTLWKQTHPPIADETSAFIQWLDEEAERAPMRREKFSLSATSNKIRSSLVKLQSPTVPEHEGAPLNLDAIAQTLIIQEQRHYESLADALESAINTLVTNDDGFSFGQIVTYVRQAFPTTNMREIYFSLLQHCANHVRSVFTENTRNRLVLIDDRFTQSTKETLPPSLAPFDNFLSRLVHLFDFNQECDLPDEEIIERQTGILGRDQVTLISELTDCGFLDIKDVAGHLPLYRLSEDFAWEGRYKLFTTAMHDWIAKKNRPVQLSEELPRTDTKDYSGSEFSLVYLPDADDILDEGDNTTFKYHDSGSDVRVANAELARVKQERLEKVDKVLANVLSKLFAGNRLSPTKYFAEQLSKELGIGQNLVQLIISGKGKEMPKVIVTVQNAISINPRLDWNHLTDYPLTQNVCKSFLEEHNQGALLLSMPTQQSN